jgi:hypothetical protein
VNLPKNLNVYLYTNIMEPQFEVFWMQKNELTATTILLNFVQRVNLQLVMSRLGLAGSQLGSGG